MGSDVKYQEAMRDVLRLLIDRAAQKSSSSGPYDEGLRMGYFEAVSSIINKLETFGVDLDEVGLRGFDPLAMLSDERQAA